jgi:hypothetical protein
MTVWSDSAKYDPANGGRGRNASFAAIIRRLAASSGERGFPLRHFRKSRGTLACAHRQGEGIDHSGIHCGLSCGQRCSVGPTGQSVVEMERNVPVPRRREQCAGKGAGVATKERCQQPSRVVSMNELAGLIPVTLPQNVRPRRPWSIITFHAAWHAQAQVIRVPKALRGKRDDPELIVAARRRRR